MVQCYKVSRTYDFLRAFAIVLNLAASIMYTFDNLQAQYGYEADMHFIRIEIGPNDNWLVKRRNKSLIPNGNMKPEAGDRVFIYTKLHLSEASNIEI